MGLHGFHLDAMLRACCIRKVRETPTTRRVPASGRPEDRTKAGAFEDMSTEKQPTAEEKPESKIEVIDLTDELMEYLSVVAQKLAASA